MKKNAFTFWQAASVLALLAIMVAILAPVLNRGRYRGDRSPSCQSRLKQIGLGFMQYTQDYDEKFPLVNSGKAAWTQLLMPYVKSPRLFHCPSVSTDHRDGTTDYFYNARLAGQNVNKLAFVTNTILQGDGIADAPADSHLSQFPPSWKTDKKSPAWRHLEGANYGWADGHVKWLKPSKLTNAKVTAMNASFAPN